MGYLKLVELIPVEKREKTADKLVNIILSSKNDNKMPRDLANMLLYQWKQNILFSQCGLLTLLKAAVLLEREKTVMVLRELQLGEMVNEIARET